MGVWDYGSGMWTGQGHAVVTYSQATHVCNRWYVVRELLLLSVIRKPAASGVNYLKRNYKNKQDESLFL